MVDRPHQGMKEYHPKGEPTGYQDSCLGMMTMHLNVPTFCIDRDELPHLAPVKSLGEACSFGGGKSCCS